MKLLELGHGVEFLDQNLNYLNRIKVNVQLTGTFTITASGSAPLSCEEVHIGLQWGVIDLTAYLVLGNVKKSYPYPFEESLDVR